MKDKIRNFVVMEGVDLFVAMPLLMMVVLLFFPNNLQLVFVLMGIFIIAYICFLYSYIWCIVHACKNKELDKNKKIVHVLLIVFLSVFYIPIYYSKYVMKNKLWYGILNCILAIICYIAMIILAVFLVFQNMTENKEVTYNSNDNFVSIKLDGDFSCKTEDIGGYNLYCFNNSLGEDVGIFNYTNRDDVDFLLDFHIKQAVDSLKKDGYKLISQKKDDNYGFTKLILEKDGKRISSIVDVKFVTDQYITIVVYSGEDDDDNEDFIEIANEILPLNSGV